MVHVVSFQLLHVPTLLPHINCPFPIANGPSSISSRFALQP